MSWTLASIRPSRRADKKYDAVFEDEYGTTKVVSFGATGYEDYTTHKDPERRARYVARHQGKENWDDAMTPGALALWILWGPTTSIEKNIKAYRRHYGI